jgi:hypothetical protein
VATDGQQRNDRLPLNEEEQMAGHEFETHEHDAVVHDHSHFHVTHNWSDHAQTFVHLSSEHSHEHDHAKLEHAHFPHEDFDSEHLGEAHDHDHGRPVAEERQGLEPTQISGEQPARKTVGKKSAAKKATAKKATAKKSTAKKAAAKKAPVKKSPAR